MDACVRAVASVREPQGIGSEARAAAVLSTDLDRSQHIGHSRSKCVTMVLSCNGGSEGPLRAARRASGCRRGKTCLRFCGRTRRGRTCRGTPRSSRRAPVSQQRVVLQPRALRCSGVHCVAAACTALQRRGMHSRCLQHRAACWTTLRLAEALVPHAAPPPQRAARSRARARACTPVASAIAAFDRSIERNLAL